MSLKSKKNNVIYFILPFFIMLVADQVLKYIIRANLTEGVSTGLPWKGVFEITLTYNKGVAFGLFQGSGVLFAPVALLLSAGTFYYVYNKPNESKFNMILLGLLASGAIGNLIDRVIFEKVTDMFWLSLINFPVFNIADVGISLSAAMIVLSTLFESKKSSS